MINTAINDNSQQIANAQTNINEEDTNENGKSETNKQKTTSSFMAMAYSYNADFFKKKQEVA